MAKYIVTRPRFLIEVILIEVIVYLERAQNSTPQNQVKTQTHNWSIGEYRGGNRGSGHPRPHLENHVAIGFLKISGTDPLREASNLLLEGGPYGLLKNTLMTKKWLSRPPPPHTHTPWRNFLDPHLWINNKQRFSSNKITAFERTAATVPRYLESFRRELRP